MEDVKTKPMAFHLKEHQHEWLKKIAEEDERTMAYILRGLIDKAIADELKE